MTKKVKRGGWPRVHSGYSLVKPLNVRKYLANIRQALIQDLAAGDESNLSTQELILVDSVISMLACTRSIEEYISVNSVMVKDDLAPSLKNYYLSYKRTIREHLVTLGLKVRMVDNTPSMEKVVAEIIKKRKK